MSARNRWFGGHLFLCCFPLILKYVAPKTYTKHRIPLVVAIRFTRVLGVAFVIVNNQNLIWEPAAGRVQCPLSLFASQYMKLAYLLCQVLAHQVPLIHHIWLISLNAAVVLISIPGRCQAECSLSTEFRDCSVYWMNKLAKLDEYWIFSASTPDYIRQNMEPWQACAVLQSFFAVRV